MHSFHLRKCFDGSKLFLRPSTKYGVSFLMLALVEAMCCYSALLLTVVVASQPCLGSDTLTRVNGNQAKQCPKTR